MDSFFNGLALGKTAWMLPALGNIKIPVLLCFKSKRFMHNKMVSPQVSCGKSKKDLLWLSEWLYLRYAKNARDAWYFRKGTYTTSNSIMRSNPVSGSIDSRFKGDGNSQCTVYEGKANVEQVVMLHLQHDYLFDISIFALLSFDILFTLKWALPATQKKKHTL